jgi:CheY-like chemotaxis protein
VLVVDDDADVRELLVTLMEDDGYQVSCACDGQEALREVLLRWPDVILLDLEMPGMNGWDFLRVQSEHPRLAAIPVVVISGLDAPPGVAAAVRKPFLVETVLAAVHRVAGLADGTPTAAQPPAATGPLLRIVRDTPAQVP